MAQFELTGWGFAVLLVLTLLAGVVLNSLFLMSFLGNPNIRKTPHWTFLALASRDLLVALLLVPTALDWFVVNSAAWSGGQAWCSIAGFLDFTLATAYPLILVILAITLFTRSYVPAPLPPLDFDVLPDPDGPLNGTHGPGSQMGGPNATSSRAPSVVISYKSPSVVGSETGYRNGYNSRGGRPTPMRGGGFGKAPFHVAPNRPGSVTGSIEGRLAAGRMRGGIGGGPRTSSAMSGARPPYQQQNSLQVIQRRTGALFSPAN